MIPHSDVQLTPPEETNGRVHVLDRSCWCKPIIHTHTRAARSYVHHQRMAPVLVPHG